jgi:cation-transporting P-type ATPase E
MATTEHVDDAPTSAWRGLTTVEVREREAAGQVNARIDRSSRRYTDIVRANVFTRFNAVITILAAVVLVFGDPIDAIFAGVMVFNMTIGIVQEIRAKRTLDEMRILVTPTVVVVRDGQPVELSTERLVTDDVIRLRTGDQVPVDGSCSTRPASTSTSRP